MWFSILSFFLSFFSFFFFEWKLVFIGKVEGTRNGVQLHVVHNIDQT